VGVDSSGIAMSRPRGARRARSGRRIAEGMPPGARSRPSGGRASSAGGRPVLQRPGGALSPATRTQPGTGSDDCGCHDQSVDGARGGGPPGRRSWQLAGASDPLSSTTVHATPSRCRSRRDLQAVPTNTHSTPEPAASTSAVPGFDVGWGECPSAGRPMRILRGCPHITGGSPNGRSFRGSRPDRRSCGDARWVRSSPEAVATGAEGAGSSPSCTAGASTRGRRAESAGRARRSSPRCPRGRARGPRHAGTCGPRGPRPTAR
jgi:hypothetical protein